MITYFITTCTYLLCHSLSENHIFVLPAPSAPRFLSSVDVPPSNLHGPRITLSWCKPAEPNGVLRGYTLFYSHGGVVTREISGIDKDALNHTVDVLGGVTYQFHVRAVTIRPGPNGTITVTTSEYSGFFTFTVMSIAVHLNTFVSITICCSDFIVVILVRV